MTEGYMPTPKPFWSGGAVYVSTGGNDTTGNGTLDQPYLTIQTAINNAANNDMILVMPGTYIEQLTIAANTLYFGAMVPGSVTVQFATAGQSAVTFNAAAAGCFWEGINITHTDNGNAASAALTVDNSAAGLTGQFIFRKCRLTAGTGTPQATIITGAAGVATTVDIESCRAIGGNQVTIGNVGDLITYRDCMFVNGPVDWFRVTGGAAGTCQLINCDLLGTAGTETFDYGNAAATTAIAVIRNSRLNGALHLNTTAAGGYVIVNKETWVRNVTYTGNSLRMHKHLGGDEWEFGVYNVDCNGTPTVTIYTIPAGRTFHPAEVITENRAIATAGTTNYRYNGTGAASIVAAVGAGAIQPGCDPETVLNDSVAAAGTIVFDVTATGGAGALLNAHVRGFIE